MARGHFELPTERMRGRHGIENNLTGRSMSCPVQELRLSTCLAGLLQSAQGYAMTTRASGMHIAHSLPPERLGTRATAKAEAPARNTSACRVVSRTPNKDPHAVRRAIRNIADYTPNHAYGALPWQRSQHFPATRPYPVFYARSTAPAILMSLLWRSLTPTPAHPKGREIKSRSSCKAGSVPRGCPAPTHVPADRRVIIRAS